MEEYVVLDFETANPKRVSACSVGGCVIAGGEIVDKFATFIKPPPEAGNFAPINVRIHGITPDKVADAPTFGELLPKFAARVKGRYVLSYSKFDRSVIDNLLDYYGASFLRYKHIDVCELAKSRIAGLENYKLPTVAKHLGIESFRHHDACDDALACARVFLALNGFSEAVSPPPVETDVREMKEAEVSQVFGGFVDSITEDGIIDYKEATELLWFLAIMPQTKTVGLIRESLNEVLEDGKVDQCESDRLLAQLAYAKGHLFE